MRSLFALCLLGLSFLANAGVPSDFTLKKSVTGWKLYYSSSRNAYVQVIDLKYVKIDMECFSYPAKEKCKRVKITDFWNKISTNSKTLSVSSGQFHDFATDAKMALAVSNRNRIIGEGYESYSNSPKRMIMFYDQSAVIYPFYNKNFFINASQGAILGFHPTKQNMNSKGKIGRTLLGLKGNNNSCNPEYATCPMRYVYIINAKSSSQEDALTIATDFGLFSSAVTMLDGSGSTQMKSKYTSAFYGNGSRGKPDYRTVPQYMVVRKK